MQRPSPSSFRIPRWLLWSLAPIAMAALLSTSIDVVQASVGGTARQQQAGAQARQADAVPTDPAAKQR